MKITAYNCIKDKIEVELSPGLNILPWNAKYISCYEIPEYILLRTIKCYLESGRRIENDLILDKNEPYTLFLDLDDGYSYTLSKIKNETLHESLYVDGKEYYDYDVSEGGTLCSDVCRFRMQSDFSPRNLDWSDIDAYVKFTNIILEGVGFEKLDKRGVPEDGVGVENHGSGYRAVVKIAEELFKLQTQKLIVPSPDLLIALHPLTRRRFVEVVKNLDIRGYLITWNYE